MSNADDLLNEMLASEPSLALINPETEPHIVIGSDRVISVPSELRKIAVQYDHKIETVTFDCPRYWDDQDMYEMRIYINYRRSDGVVGMSIPTNIIIDDLDTNIMHFDWTITRGATLVSGTLAFNVCVKKANLEGNEEVHWNSELNTQMTVSPGLEYEEQMNPQAADLISDLIDRMEETEYTVEKAGIIINTQQMNALLTQFNGLKAELAKRTETLVFSATISASSWTTDAPPYTNIVSIPGVKDDDSPHATPVYSTESETAIKQEEAWNMISSGDALTDAIKFVCFEEYPAIDIPIQVECFRTWKEA